MRVPEKNKDIEISGKLKVKLLFSVEECWLIKLRNLPHPEHLKSFFSPLLSIPLYF